MHYETIDRIDPRTGHNGAQRDGSIAAPARAQATNGSLGLGSSLSTAELRDIVLEIMG